MRVMSLKSKKLGHKMKKHKKRERVQYCGTEFPKSRGHEYFVTKVSKCRETGVYYHDIKAIRKPRPVTYTSPLAPKTDDDKQHSEVLLSIEFGDLVKL